MEFADWVVQHNRDTPKALNGGESAAVGSVTAISPFSKRVRRSACFLLPSWKMHMCFVLAANGRPKSTINAHSFGLYKQTVLARPFLWFLCHKTFLLLICQMWTFMTVWNLTCFNWFWRTSQNVIKSAVYGYARRSHWKKHIMYEHSTM